MYHSKLIYFFKLVTDLFIYLYSFLFNSFSVINYAFSSWCLRLSNSANLQHSDFFPFFRIISTFALRKGFCVYSVRKLDFLWSNFSVVLKFWNFCTKSQQTLKNAITKTKKNIAIIKYSKTYRYKFSQKLSYVCQNTKWNVMNYKKSSQTCLHYSFDNGCP